jgi:hypothetical protein
MNINFQNILNSNLFLFILVLLIVFIEYTVERKTIGIVILHNNEHTLNKLLQFIMTLMEHKEIHYQIIVVKEKRVDKNKRSSGFLFNLGYRHLQRFNNYLFIDSTYCSLPVLYKKLPKLLQLDTREIFVKNKINYLEDICGVFVSRDYFKSHNGFSNRSNKSFKKFIDIIRNMRKNTNGYLEINQLELKYDILDKSMLSNVASKITINYLN